MLARSTTLFAGSGEVLTVPGSIYGSTNLLHGVLSGSRPATSLCGFVDRTSRSTPQPTTMQRPDGWAAVDVRLARSTEFDSQCSEAEVRTAVERGLRETPYWTENGQRLIGLRNLDGTIRRGKSWRPGEHACGLFVQPEDDRPAMVLTLQRPDPARPTYTLRARAVVQSAAAETQMAGRPPDERRIHAMMQTAFEAVQRAEAKAAALP